MIKNTDFYVKLVCILLLAMSITYSLTLGKFPSLCLILLHYKCDNDSTYHPGCCKSKINVANMFH